MSENERTADDLACELGTARCPNRQTLAEHIAAELAAAEERGRRRGVEEIPESVKLIAAERKRQVEQEHWTPSHDDTHNDGELASAAACYALYEQRNPPKIWPWDREWWKPGTDPIRRLVKAGALIAAEIERLQRDALAPRDSGKDNATAADPYDRFAKDDEP